MGITGSSSAGAYAVPVSSPTSSSSAIFRNATSTALLATTLDGVHTLYDNFLCGVQSSAGSGEGPCLGERDGKTYKWQSYNTVLERAKFIGSALQGAYKHVPQTMVGLFSQNSASWVLVEQACNAYSLISVPLYDTLGPDAAEYIINSTQMRTIACTKDKTKGLLTLASKCPSLTLIIELDSPAGATLKRGAIEIISLPSLELIGKLNPKAPVPPRPSDLATIVFTSGTTDMPKGVMLTHGNFAAAGAGAASSGVDLYNTDVHISYLPLAHVFERIVQTCIFHRGAAVGFFSGDVQKLLEDMAILKPTIFPSVPRLFNRVYDKVMAGVAASPPMKKALFNIALDSKTWYLQQGGHVTHPLYDRLVFSKLRELMGGRVRLMITGSAPISSAVKDFLQVAFCAPVLEGYGLSETVGIVTISPVQARSLPGVGCPVTCSEIKLADIPEMGYLHVDQPHPRGEICMRGPNIFLGYYKAPALTAEAIDADGWFHSGDVGRITEEGTLVIFDRKKNIFKLSQGEYVAPEKIENVYQRSAFVAQAFVHGDSLMSSLVGIIVPDPDTVSQWANTAGVPFDMTALCRTNAAFRKAVEDSMVAAAKAGGLKGFECVKTFFLEPSPFSVENDLLTPTFKLKRHQLKGRYAAEIHDMYKALGEV